MRLWLENKRRVLVNSRRWEARERGIVPIRASVAGRLVQFVRKTNNSEREDKFYGHNHLFY